MYIAFQANGYVMDMLIAKMHLMKWIVYVQRMSINAVDVIKAVPVTEN